MTLFEAFELEQKILSDFKEYRVFTKWSTEIFKRDIYEYIKIFF